MTNVKLPAVGTGDTTPSVATETIAGVEYQKVKILDATAASTTGLKVDSNGAANVSDITTATAQTTVQTSVAGTSGSIVSLNAARKKILIQNVGSGVVRVSANATATATNGLRLQPGDSFMETGPYIYTGAWTAIRDGATSSTVAVTEWQ